jgi:large subunit ribosomal protein L6
MSRIGKNPIDLPEKVIVTVKNSTIVAKGPQGELTWILPQLIDVQIKNNQIIVERKSETRQAKSLHGLSRSLISNMVRGVTQGFTKVLEIHGTGYRAKLEGNKVVFTLGYSHPIAYALPEGVKADVDKKQTKITLTSIDKQLIGQVAANMRSLRPPDSYKGKGVRYENERLRLKEGKKG